MRTVKQVADPLDDHRATLDEAAEALRGVQRTERPRLTSDEKLLGADIEPGGDNDTSQHDVAGVRRDDQHSEMARTIVIMKRPSA